MSPKALHAVLTLLIGVAFGIVWLRAFWNEARPAPAAVLALPLAAAVLGLGHWVAYDFSVQHWAGDFSLLQAAFNLAVTAALFYRPRATIGHATT
jgi:hypothetical protein